MFKKIVSNLPFSPALIGQLSFYAKRLKSEEVTRRTALMFVVLAIIVQSVAVFQPPESANASSANDLVVGGLHGSLNNFMVPYDANTRHLKDIMNYAGITRAEILNTTYTTWTVNNTRSWGMLPRFSYSQGERQHNIPDASGKIVATAYSRPLSLWTSSTSKVSGWVGKSARLGWFAIMNSCGNLVNINSVPPPPPPPPTVTIVMCEFNPTLRADDANCKPCPGNDSLWINDPACIPNINRTKTATNLSQAFRDAGATVAKAGDRISYTIAIENTGLNSEKIKIEDDLSDVLEYSKLIDNGGGSLNKETSVLSWPDITLEPKQKQTRTFVVGVLDPIPATPKGLSDATSYDCVMLNTFGNSTSIAINCPTPKIVEQVVTELPTTGPTENMIFAGVALGVIAYFYARTKQLNKEVRLIRRDAVAGMI